MSSLDSWWGRRVVDVFFGLLVGTLGGGGVVPPPPVPCGVLNIGTAPLAAYASPESGLCSPAICATTSTATKPRTGVCQRHACCCEEPRISSSIPIRGGVVILAVTNKRASSWAGFNAHNKQLQQARRTRGAAAGARRCSKTAR